MFEKKKKKKDRMRIGQTGPKKFGGQVCQDLETWIRACVRACGWMKRGAAGIRGCRTQRDESLRTRLFLVVQGRWLIRHGNSSSWRGGKTLETETGLRVRRLNCQIICQTRNNSSSWWSSGRFQRETGVQHCNSARAQRSVSKGCCGFCRNAAPSFLWHCGLAGGACCVVEPGRCRRLG